MSKSSPRRNNEIINSPLLIWVLLVCTALCVINPLIIMPLVIVLATCSWVKTTYLVLFVLAIICAFFVGGESIFYPVFFLAVHAIGHSVLDINMKGISTKQRISLAVGATILLIGYVILNWSPNTAIMFLIVPTLVYWLYVLRRSPH